MNEKLKFYHIDIKYIRNLSKKDDRVRSVSPQTGKSNRPLVGVVVLLNGKKYCIPLSSPKPKHTTMKNSPDFHKITLVKNGKQRVIGVLNFNNMIPVTEDVITPVDMRIKKSGSASDKAYIELLNNQLDWCNDNREKIFAKAQKLYDIVTAPTKSTSSQLLKRCCDFKRLETVLDKYVSKLNADLN